MKKILFSLLTAILFVSCASTNAATRQISKQYTVNSSFSAIHVQSNIEVDYDIANKVSIVASADAEYLSLLKIYVKNNTLYLETKNHDNNFNSDRDAIKVKLSAPLLRSYSTSGNAQLDVNSMVKIDGLVNINTTGNSEIEFKQTVDCGNIELGTSGNSQVSFDKKLICTAIKAGTSGNSSLDIDAITCQTIQLGSSGNSEVDVKNINAVKVNAGSSGNSGIDLSGKADNVSLKASGNSEIDGRKLVARNSSVSSSGNATVNGSSYHD